MIVTGPLQLLSDVTGPSDLPLPAPQVLLVRVCVQPPSLSEVAHVEARERPELQLRASEQGYQRRHLSERQVCPRPRGQGGSEEVKAGSSPRVLPSDRLGLLFRLVSQGSRESPWQACATQQRGGHRPPRCRSRQRGVTLRADLPGSQRERQTEPRQRHRTQRREGRELGPSGHGVLRLTLLLLHLWLRVHQQREPAGAHERARGGDRQHHPQQGARHRSELQLERRLPLGAGCASQTRGTAAVLLRTGPT